MTGSPASWRRIPRGDERRAGRSGRWGGSIALFALAPDPWLGLGLLAVAGAADTAAVVSRSTILQIQTPDPLLGRVTAAEQIVAQAGPDLGNLRAGLVAAATSGVAALLTGGLLCVAAVAAIAATSPGLRRYRDGSDRYEPGLRPTAA